MGRDLDFSSIDRPSGPYERAYKNQDFKRPTQESPFSNPPGWHGGRVDQTGGMIMVRQWRTHPGIGTVHEERPGRRVEYKIAYAQEPSVTMERYRWNGDAFRDGRGAYEYDGTVEHATPPENTDEAKARIARKLMKKHSDKTA
jgi:hypothetical protein